MFIVISVYVANFTSCEAEDGNWHIDYIPPERKPSFAVVFVVVLKFHMGSIRGFFEQKYRVNYVFQM